MSIRFAAQRNTNTNTLFPAAPRACWPCELMMIEHSVEPRVNQAVVFIKQRAAVALLGLWWQHPCLCSAT